MDIPTTLDELTDLILDMFPDAVIESDEDSGELIICTSMKDDGTGDLIPVPFDDELPDEDDEDTDND